jgi:hypothetical protein
MKRLIILIVISISSLLFMNSMGAFTYPWIDKDKALLTALNNHQLKKFKKLLDDDANPNKIFGSNYDDWVMCLATERGNAAFLKLAIEYGGNINLRNRIKPVRTITSAPILCAITNHSTEAFNYLLNKNVDLTIHTYEEAQPVPLDSPIDPVYKGKTLYGSPLLHASSLNEYCMALEIMKKITLNWQELVDIKKDVEFSMVDPNSKKDKCRWKIVEILRQQGQDVDPKRAMKEHQKRRKK